MVVTVDMPRLTFFENCFFLCRIRIRTILEHLHALTSFLSFCENIFIFGVLLVSTEAYVLTDW